jgi:L-lactate dehydrogenase
VSRAELVDDCKHKSQRIIQAKGATPFGIGSIVASICSSILLDKRNVRPISHFQPEMDCFLSAPVVLGRKGIIQTIHLPLNADEKAELDKAAKIQRDLVQRIKAETSGWS